MGLFFNNEPSDVKLKRKVSRSDIHKMGLIGKKSMSPPKGWRKLKGAATAPVGSAWYSNNKSRFSKDYKSGLFKVSKK